uniref:Uncharacterized protein At5g05190 n=1 Tax=Anthurium amnicola TaxID=1678845 RepID=A0A1D1XZT2_9ARAE
MGSEVRKLRFVRCPRCRRLLVEVSGVPVYKCGGCGVVLQEKSRHPNNGDGTSQMPNNLPENKSETSSDVPTLNEQTDPYHTDAEIVEMGRGKDLMPVLCDHPPCSISENSSHEGESSCSKEEDPSECKENGNLEVGSASGSQDFTGQSAVMGEDTISVASAQKGNVVEDGAGFHSNQQLEGSWKLRQHGSANSSSSCKMGESTQSAVSEAEMVDKIGRVATPTARSSHAYRSSISSCDEISGKREMYRLRSRRTVRNRNYSVSNSTQGEDEEEQKGERGDSGALGISGSKQRLASSYVSHTPSLQDPSQDCENLCSDQEGLENDHRPRSVSTDSSSGDFSWNASNGIRSNTLGNLRKDLVAPPTKGDVLRDILTRHYAGLRRGDQRFAAAGASHEQLPTPFCNSNIPQWRSRAFGQTSSAQYPSHTSGIPFSGVSSSSSYSPHIAEGWNIPEQLPSSICCRACGSQPCYHPSSAVGSRCCSETSHHDTGKLPCKERRQRPRSHCRPVSGGAPFVICNSCLEVLQLPVDFLLSVARRHKLRCGGCSQVLIFLYHGGHIVPQSSAQLDTLPTEVNNAMNHGSKHEQSVNHSHDSLQGDPVSYCEEYGPPVSKSYSTDGEPAPFIMRSPLQQESRSHGKQALDLPLHRLMGYASARDVMFVPSDEEEGYDSIDVSRYHRTSDDVDLEEGDGGIEMGSPHQVHSAVEYSPDSAGTGELNHRLDNMKLRVRGNGRTLRDPW